MKERNRISLYEGSINSKLHVHWLRKLTGKIHANDITH